MKSLAELDQLNLDPATKSQLAEMFQSLLEQGERDAEKLQAKDNELQQKDIKIQALTHELAHLRRSRYGVKNENLSLLQRDLFEESWNTAMSLSPVNVGNAVKTWLKSAKT